MLTPMIEMLSTDSFHQSDEVIDAMSPLGAGNPSAAPHICTMTTSIMAMMRSNSILERREALAVIIESIMSAKLI